MAEGKYVPCECARKLTTADAFLGGVLEFPCQVGAPNGLDLSRSYFRVGMSLYGAHAAGVATAPSVPQMVAFADNAVGNLFDKAEVTVNNQRLSTINQGLPQASALRTRLGNSSAWLKSLGSPELHEANFPKRVNASASNAANVGNSPNAAFCTDNEMFKPVADGAFSTATVSVSTFIATVAPFLTTATYNAVGPAVNTTNSNAVISFTVGAAVAGLGGTRFTDRMPDMLTGAATGSPVLPGDILVISGIQYPIKAMNSDTSLTLACTVPAAITATNDWYIMRKDVVRSPQAKNTVYAVWRPPMGIFDYDGILGCGNYTFSLSPNSRYLTSAVETRNPSALSSVDGKTNDYSLVVNSITFFAYIEKASFSDTTINIPTIEFQVIPKPWESTVQFSVSQDTTALTFFVQDLTAGINPRIPQSMFKVLDNSDLKLASIQVSFGGISKPATEIKSNFYNGVDQMQQYYRDSYDESGLLKSDGAETYYDFLQRGPFYHYNFPKDVNNMATEVTVTTNFTGLSAGPGSGAIGGTGKALLYCVAHFKRTVEIETQAGMVKRISTVAS